MAVLSIRFFVAFECAHATSHRYARRDLSLSCERITPVHLWIHIARSSHGRSEWQPIILGIERVRNDAIIELDPRTAAPIFSHLEPRRRLHAHVEAARVSQWCKEDVVPIAIHHGSKGRIDLPDLPEFPLAVLVMPRTPSAVVPVSVDAPRAAARGTALDAGRATAASVNVGFVRRHVLCPHDA